MDLAVGGVNWTNKRGGVGADMDMAGDSQSDQSIFSYLGTFLDNSFLCKPHTSADDILIRDEQRPTRSSAGFLNGMPWSQSTAMVTRQGRGSGREHSAGDMDSAPEFDLTLDTSERLDQSTHPLVKDTKGIQPNLGRSTSIDQPSQTLSGSGDEMPNRSVSAGSSVQRSPSKQRVRYLHIPRHSLKDFQRFAREAAVDAECELLLDNPYVQALVNYRAEMQAFAISPTSSVPSVEQILSTQRENLALLSPPQASPPLPGSEVSKPPCGDVLTWCGPQDCPNRGGIGDSTLIACSSTWMPIEGGGSLGMLEAESTLV